MKRLILTILFMILFVCNAFSQTSEDGVVQKAKKKAQNVIGCECPEIEIDSTVSVTSVDREELDIGVRLNIMDYAGNGGYSLNLENFDFIVSMNLNRVMFIYGWYGIRNVESDKIENAVTDESWHFKYAVIGAGFYFTPILKIFAGTGKVIEARNKGDVQEYDLMKEYGIGFDKHINGYKLELAWRFAEVPLASDKITAEEYPAKGDFMAVSIGITAPFSLW